MIVESEEAKAEQAEAAAQVSAANAELDRLKTEPADKTELSMPLKQKIAARLEPEEWRHREAAT